MTTAPLAPAPTAVLLQRMRAATAKRTAAEVELVELASAWAHAHTIAPASSRLEGYDPLAPLGMDEVTASAEEVEWYALPELRWDAAASFAAAQGLTTAAGADLLRDVLTLELRLPLTWARIRSGQVAVWRGRRIAQRVLGLADDVVALVDYNIAPKAHSVGVTGIDHLIDTVMLQRHAEQVELEAMEAAEERYARAASPVDAMGCRSTSCGPTTPT
ncbi:hypothetical protein [Nocardioides flavescens]|uniref:DUF222 domain-containing protein n=1 Tax=Nocardioides flavescens TaxID=2691959 RepID=A0A6L7EZZ3_9ACTN|nr:hypothetical protein [Nocardioides flavescens]MXG91448.1 hypothetical protein [Nocardioides flavescens]